MVDFALAVACALIYLIPMRLTYVAFSRYPQAVQEIVLPTAFLMRRFGVGPGLAIMAAFGLLLILAAYLLYPTGLWILLLMHSWNAWNDIHEMRKLRRIFGDSGEA